MNLSFYAGDSRNLIVTVVDQNGEIVPLTGATIKWILVSQDTIMLSKKTDSGITLSDPAMGQFTIALTASDTKTLNGTYQHMARVTTADGNSSIVLTGTVIVEGSLV